MNKIRYLIAASVSFSLHASMLFGIEENKETLFTTSQNQASVSLSFASMPVAKAEQTPIAETKTAQEAIPTAKAKQTTPSAQAKPASQARSQLASNSAQTSQSLISQKTTQQAVQPKEAQTTAKTNSVKPIAEEKPSPVNTNSAQPQPIKSQTPKQNLATAQAKAPTTEPSTTQTNNKHLPTQQQSTSSQSTNQQYISQQNISQQPVASTQPVMIKNANFLKTPVQPDYPRSARQRGQQGIVTYEVWLDENGRQIKQVLIKSSGISSLDRSALKAIKQWQFSPYTINNKGVPHRVQIPVNFKLDS